MKGKFFLDTNIFVSSFDAHMSGSAPTKAKISVELIDSTLQTKQGVVSYQVVQEFFNVATRRFSVPLTPAESEQYLASVFRPLLGIHSSAALYFEALQLSAKHRLPWYDSLIVAAAIEANCSILYSEDFQDGREFGKLRVVNPFS
ncbi:MAG TPA: PIN domain-containing protein [Terriglobales bacterium]|jgi:predicted nucleic acid-binding protein|nr:PIN domain-containing protein [Terriglobales bacterium]